MKHPFVLGLFTFVSFFVGPVTTVHAQVPQALGQAAVSPESAKERTCALIKTMRALDNNVAKAVSGRSLDAYFDFDTLSRAPIQPHAAQLSSKDQAQLQQAFGKLIRLLAYQAGQNFRSGDVTLTTDATDLQARRRCVGLVVARADDDDDTRIDFVWANHKGTLKVVDVALDGASIVKDYENQFGRILHKEGARALVNKMQSRLVEAQRKRPT